MVSFDAFALATAIGIRTPGSRLRLGPLPISVRTPAAIALGAKSVAALTGCEIDVALGASSPAIVTGWHDRAWLHSAARMRETIECLSTLLRGERSNYDGSYVRSHGSRLRHPLPHTRIGVGSFGVAMTRLAAEVADEVVLNLASPERVALVRKQIDDHAATAHRKPPRLTVWVPLAMRPGEASLRQAANQLAVYLAPPGYGEMFCGLGFSDLVERARGGARRWSWRPRYLSTSGTTRGIRRSRTNQCPIAGLPGCRRRYRRDSAGRGRRSCRPRRPRMCRRDLPPLFAYAGDRLMKPVNTQCRLAARPTGLPKATDFTIDR